MKTMRIWALSFVLAGCGGMSQAPPDLDARDMALAADLVPGSGAAPAGFGAACTSSSDCRGYAIDAGPGFLGCGSYLGADYCTMPCAPSAGGVDRCWTGSSCQCVTHTNAGGFQETDCYCAVSAR